LADLLILTADELKALNPLERQVARRAARQQSLMRLILRTFLQRGGPIPVEDIIAASRGARPDASHDALVALDDEDLIRVREGQIDLAYPFSASPTPFVVRLRDGKERYACCATDALGIAPMIGQAVEVRSGCHHCKAALTFTATPQGPGPEANGIMLWFGKRVDDQCKAFDSL
jgi:hypothetical protein